MFVKLCENPLSFCVADLGETVPFTEETPSDSVASP